MADRAVAVLDVVLLLAVARPTGRRTLTILVSQRGGAREIRQSRAADADPRPVKRLSSSRRVLAALRRVDDDRRFRWVLTARGARVPPVSVAARLRRVDDDPQ